MQVPCKDCPDRKLGCHSVCEKYIAFDKYRQEVRKARWKKSQELEDILRSHRYKKKKWW